MKEFKNNLFTPWSITEHLSVCFRTSRTVLKLTSQHLDWSSNFGGFWRSMIFFHEMLHFLSWWTVMTLFGNVKHCAGTWKSWLSRGICKPPQMTLTLPTSSPYPPPPPAQKLSGISSLCGLFPSGQSVSLQETAASPSCPVLCCPRSHYQWQDGDPRKASCNQMEFDGLTDRYPEESMAEVKHSGTHSLMWGSVQYPPVETKCTWV